MSKQKELQEYKIKNPVDNKNKVVIILSGGVDSTTLLAKLIREKKQVYAITFNYGQKHIREIESAIKICKYYKVAEHKIIDLPVLRGSALTNKDDKIPEGHYAQENMKLTVVPNRNMIMLSVAAAYAEGLKIKEVYYGAHSGDHYCYWDTRPYFLEAINNVLKLNDISNVQIKAPYIKLDKGDIICIGWTLKVPYELTWTCYVGKDIPCLKCGACVERREAFQKADLKDPLL